MRSESAGLGDAVHKYPAEVPTKRDKRLAALCHFGLPIYGPFLPLTLHLAARGGPFRRDHYDQALAFQLVILIPYGVIAVLSAFGMLPWFLLTTYIILVLVLETWNAFRAIGGKPPTRIVPLSPLNREIAATPTRA